MNNNYLETLFLKLQEKKNEDIKKSYTAKLVIPADPMRVFAGDIPAPVNNDAISETSSRNSEY